MIKQSENDDDDYENIHLYISTLLYTIISKLVKQNEQNHTKETSSDMTACIVDRGVIFPTTPDSGTCFLRLFILESRGGHKTRF
jgi:hypothetical protein